MVKSLQIQGSLLSGRKIPGIRAAIEARSNWETDAMKKTKAQRSSESWGGIEERRRRRKRQTDRRVKTAPSEQIRRENVKNRKSVFRDLKFWH